jgi:glycosyltransferase involved in cell wall biosynthesis
MTLSAAFPNRNDSRFLKERVESLLSQSVPPDELIVVDDASTDDSVRILKELAAEHPALKLIQNPANIGVNRSANLALQNATGEFVFLAAADNTTYPGFLEKAVALLQKHPNAGFCLALADEIDQQGRRLGLTHKPIPIKEPAYLSPQDFAELLRLHRDWWSSAAIVYRRSALLEFGGYQVDLGPSADGLLVMAIALKHGLCYLPEPMGGRRVSEQSFSSSVYSSLAEWDRVSRELAKCLQSPPYSELFPRYYVEETVRGSVFNVLSRGLEAERSRLAELTPLWVDPTLIDRAYAFFLKLILAAAGVLNRLYFFLRLRRESLRDAVKSKLG